MHMLLYVIFALVLLSKLHWFAQHFEMELTDGRLCTGKFKFNHGTHDGYRAFHELTKKKLYSPYNPGEISYIQYEHDSKYSSFVNALTSYLESKSIQVPITIGVLINKRKKFDIGWGNKISLCIFSYDPLSPANLRKQLVKQSIKREKNNSRYWSIIDCVKYWRTDILIVPWNFKHDNLYVAERQHTKRGLSKCVKLAKSPKGWYVYDEN